MDTIDMRASRVVIKSITSNTIIIKQAKPNGRMASQGNLKRKIMVMIITMIHINQLREVTIGTINMQTILGRLVLNYRKNDL